MAEKLEYHHVLPLVIGGLECAENTVHITSSMHSHIHKVLNIPFKKIRKFRCDHNHLIIPTMEFCEGLQALQRSYFSNFDHLAPFAKKAHLEAFQKLNPYIMSLYGIQWGNYRDKDNTFQYQLDVYLHTMHKAYAQALK